VGVVFLRKIGENNIKIDIQGGGGRARKKRSGERAPRG
jgi:hypothetical protein